jgi:hypothetical protein
MLSSTTKSRDARALAAAAIVDLLTLACLILLSLILLAQLAEEVSSSLCRHLREIRLHDTILDRFLKDLLLIFLRSVQLPAEIPLDLKSCLVLVDAELLEQIVVILFDQTLQYLEFHHVVVVLGILGFDLANLRHWNVRQLVIEFLYSLSQINVGAFLVHSHKALRLLVEGHKLVSKSKSRSTSRLDPFGHKGLVCVLRDVWCGIGSAWIGKQAFWLKRQD